MQYTEKQACVRRSNTVCQHGAVAGVFGVFRGLADYPAIRSQQHSWTAFSSEPGLFENFMLTCSWKIQELFGGRVGIQDISPYLMPSSSANQTPSFSGSSWPQLSYLASGTAQPSGSRNASSLTLFASHLADGKRLKCQHHLQRMRFIFLHQELLEMLSEILHSNLKRCREQLLPDTHGVPGICEVICDPGMVIWAE